MHPGYGFLSEDPDFAEICASNGLVFIGPRPEVMAKLGDTALARRLMVDAGRTVLPGTMEPVRTSADVLAAARWIGLPLIIKAAAGGGGRGMSVVRCWDDLLPTFRSTAAAARSVFGDERVYVERFWERAKHVEVQLLADEHGNVVSLGERDCSVQWRHQKLMEETPTPCLAPEVPRRLGDTLSRVCERRVTRARAQWNSWWTASSSLSSK